VGDDADVREIGLICGHQSGAALPSHPGELQMSKPQRKRTEAERAAAREAEMTAVEALRRFRWIKLDDADLALILGALNGVRGEEKEARARKIAARLTASR
jgi:hypothetical protein